MNEFDREKIDGLCADCSIYERVLFEKDFRDKNSRTEQSFDWFIKRELGDFYNYRPWEDDD